VKRYAAAAAIAGNDAGKPAALPVAGMGINKKKIVRRHVPQS
jgi:hypothetical protein